MRKFRLRNGVVVVEAPGAGLELTGADSCYFAGYMDDYRIIGYPRGIKGMLIKLRCILAGKYVCLCLSTLGMPTGGAMGSDWDMVEEIHE